MNAKSDVVLDETHRMPARERLMATVQDNDPYALAGKEVAKLRLQAAQEIFAVRRQQIPILDRRARDSGVDAIRKLDDIVPLLFAHTIYKSYPASFLKQGQWARLLKWYGTLGAVPVDKVNIEGVRNVDEFIERLWQGGHSCITTSGTSGKVSFLPLVEADHRLRQQWAERHFFYPDEKKYGAPTPRHFFLMAPKSGPYLMMVNGAHFIKMWGRPETTHYLTQDSLNISYLIRAGEMREKMGDGSATADEITRYEDEVKAQQIKAAAEFEAITDELFRVRKEPLVIMAQWAVLWRILEKARACGIPDGEFSEKSIVICGGGTKGAKIPADYEKQIRDFLGPVYMPIRYAMSEQSATPRVCEKGNYHMPAWLIPLALDEPGEKLVGHGGGVVEGRFAFLDVSFHSRWGGLISSDKVRMDLSDTCACGRFGPVVLPGISRFATDEDKIGCAGTIEAYIRGALE